MARPPKHSAEKVASAKHLVAFGLSYRQAGEALGLSQYTVRDYARDRRRANLTHNTKGQAK